MELIKLNLIPNIFYEGHHDAHLEAILELPKGKPVSRFEKTDLRRAKEIIGEHSCIVGDIPNSLLMGEGPQLSARNPEPIGFHLLFNDLLGDEYDVLDVRS